MPRSYASVVFRRFFAVVVAALVSAGWLASPAPLWGQQPLSPTLVAGEVALGGDLRVAAFDVPPNASYSLRLMRDGTGITFPGVLLNSDAAGNIPPTTVGLPPDVMAGSSALELFIRTTVVASTRLEIHLAPTIVLEPETGVPGALAQFRIENLLPGTVQVAVDGIAIVGPAPVTSEPFIGAFVVPENAVRAVTISVFNRIGDRVAGRSQTTYGVGEGPNWGAVRIQEIAVEETSLAAGQRFTLRGRLDPPPFDVSQVSIEPFWRMGDGRQLPIGVAAAQLSADGVFAVEARVPSLVQGDPVFPAATDQAGVSVYLADSAKLQQLVDISDRFGFLPRFAVLAVKDMPGSPQDGQPIPNLPAPGPGDKNPVHIEIEPLGVFATTLSETVDINGIVPVLDVDALMTQFQLQQAAEYVNGYVANCVLLVDIFSDIKRWEWVMGPHETTILTHYENSVNPFNSLAQFNSIQQFNASQGQLGVGSVPRALARSENMVTVEVYRVLVDALSVVDGSQRGYGFMNEDGYAERYRGVFAYVREHNLIFEITIPDDAPLFGPGQYAAIPTANPAPLRIPPLPAEWQSPFGIRAVTIAGRDFDLMKYGPIPPPDVLEPGPFWSLVKPQFGGSGVNPAFQLLSTGGIPIEVRLVRGGDGASVPDVSMTYRGSPLPVTRVEVGDDTPAPNPCSKSNPVSDPLNIYRWRAVIPTGHLQPVGKYNLVITASEGGTSTSKQARLEYIPYPGWFDGGNLSNKRIEWEPRLLRFRANPATASTNVQANVPEIGNKNNQVTMGQQEIECRVYASGQSQLNQTGSMGSVALNNNASPLGYDGTGTCGGNELPSVSSAALAGVGGGLMLAHAVGLDTVFDGPESASLALSADGLVSVAGVHEVNNVQTTTLLDTGRITVFAYSFGIPGIASVNISVDFRVRASASINTTVPSAVQTLFDAGVEVRGTVSVTVLLGLASGSGQFITDIGVQIPATFRLDGQIVEPGKCFYYGMHVRVVVKAFWVTVYDKTHRIFRGSTPDNCFQSWAAAIAQGTIGGADFARVAQDEPSVPNAGPALVTDGLGQWLMLWSTEDDQVVYSSRNGGAWSDPIGLAPGARGGDPAVAFYASGKAVAVWSQTGLTEQPPEDTPLAEVLRTQHLVYATWEDGVWSQVENLTAPTTGDGLVALAGCMSTDPACPVNGAVTAAWVHDPAGDFSQRRFNIHHATFANGGWAPVTALEDNIEISDTEPAVVYRNGIPALMWVRDPDRSLDTFDDRVLGFRFLTAGQPITLLTGLPGGVLDPSLDVDGDGNFQIAFSRVGPDDLPIGNRRMLYRGKGECAGLSCTWNAAQVVDGAGRTIFAENPIVNVVPAAAGQEIAITYRALGVDPVAAPNTPLLEIPEPVGVVNGTGELAQIHLPLQLGNNSVNPNYLTNDGAVNWQPAAVYDPLLNSVVSLAVQKPIVAVAQSDVGNQAQPVHAGQPLVLADAPQLPNFVLSHGKLDMQALGGAVPLPVEVTVRNSGVEWSAAEGDPLLVIHARWGTPTGPLAGQVTVESLGRDESKKVTLAVHPPVQANQAQLLYLIVNPGQSIAEQTALDNTWVIQYPGLPVPYNLLAQSVAGQPSIWLTWNTPEDARIEGYRVYRIGEGGTRTPVGSSFVKGWLDAAAEWDEAVRYGVVAYGADLAESDMALVDARAGVPLPSSAELPALFVPHAARE